MIDRFAKALRAAGLELDWRDLADVLWLAQATGARATPHAPDDRRRAAASVGLPDASMPSRQGTPSPSMSPEPTAALVTAAYRPRREGLNRGGQQAMGLRVTAPARYALPGRLEIGRALRPLKHRRPAPRSQVFDADATVEQYCDTGLLVPVMTSALEPWFDVAVIADVSPTMKAWHDTIQAFTELLERHGAFRNVTSWLLVEREGALRVLTRSGVEHEPHELADLSGHRLILVVSDCVGPLWRDDGAWAALRDWGRSGPVALVQTLPARLWPLTAMGDADLELTAHRPGQPNQQLAFTRPWWSPKAPLKSPIPVVTFDAELLAPWARMVMGAGWVTVTGVAAEPPPLGVLPSPAGRSAAELVEIFRTTVSAEAFRLATWLSAVEVSLPVARILLERLSSEPRVEHLAEVLAGGLFRSLTAADGFQSEPDLDFLPGVRELLQDSLTTTAVIEVWRTITPYLEETGHRPQFSVLLNSGAADTHAGSVFTEAAGQTAMSRLAADLVKRLGLSDGGRRWPDEESASTAESIPAAASGTLDHAGDDAAQVGAHVQRLVFRLQEFIERNQTSVLISLEQPEVSGGESRRFRPRPDDPAFEALRAQTLQPDAVRQAGRRLFDAITEHPDIRSQLNVALRAPPSQRCPLFVETATSASAEALPWETLCSPGGQFLGLDERWAIGRMVAGATMTSPYWQLTPTLRLAAILSALGVPAAEEWRALQDAIGSTASQAIEVLVFVSEDTLYDEIRAAVAEGRVSGVQVEFVPHDLNALRSTVAGFRPDVLHFLCHRSAEADPHLEVAVRSDWVVGADRGSLFVEAQDIGNFTSRTNERPWLIVLNGCESDRLALELVRDGRVAAAIGMREPLTSSDAAVFTEAFYRRLLSDLSTRIVDPERVGSIDCAQLVVQARTQLAMKHGTTLTEAAASTKQWAFPVVYMRPEPLRVQLPDTADESEAYAAADPLGREDGYVDPAAQQSDLAISAQDMVPLMLRNVSSDKFHFTDPADPQRLSAPGCIIASPSFDRDLSRVTRNYVYNWTRDAAIAAVEIALAAGRLNQPLIDYVRFAQICQNSGGDFDRASFLINGAPRDWTNQTDGPALQTLAILQLFTQLDAPTQAVANAVINANQNFLQNAYQGETYNLWEEAYGASFFARSVQLKSFQAITANNLGIPVPGWLSTAVPWLQNALQSHWNGQYYQSLLPVPTKYRASYDPNIDIVMAAIYGAVAVTDTKLLATAALLRSQWADPASDYFYPINRDDQQRGIGPMLGRYPGDMYDGDTDAPMGDHPWVVSTANFAELYYRLAKQITTTGTVPLADLSASFFSQIGVDAAATPTAAAAALQSAGDQMLQAVVYHSDHLELSEQFDATTGYEKGARNLTWSYAAFLSAVRARDQAVAAN